MAAHRSMAGRQFGQQGRTDGEQITAGQRQNLPRAPEARPHHLASIAEALVIGVDTPYRQYARIVFGRVVLPGTCPVPVEDAPHERADQRHPGVGTGHRLGKAEQQRQVAVHALAFQHARRLDALPGGGNLDQHPLARNAGCLIQPDEPLRPGHRTGRRERQAGIHLGRYPAGDDGKNLLPEGHQQPVGQLVHRCLRVRGLHCLQQTGVFGLLYRLQDE